MPPVRFLLIALSWLLLAPVVAFAAAPCIDGAARAERPQVANALGAQLLRHQQNPTHWSKPRADAAFASGEVDCDVCVDDDPRPDYSVGTPGSIHLALSVDAAMSVCPASSVLAARVEPEVALARAPPA